ncbi:MAG: hypothetical protein ACYC9L_08225 [Sulfuricaulis sp.]
MPKPATTKIERTLVQAAMEILQDDFCRAHGERPTAAALAEELYNRRESSAVTRHIKHGQPLAHHAVVNVKRLSPDAGVVLGDWEAALSPRTSVSELRGVLARALHELDATRQLIAMLTSRDVPEVPDAFWDSLADHPVSSWFVVHAVLLRRCQYGAPVHIAMAQAWRTGVSLVQNCIARPCLRAAAPTVWEGALQFIPPHHEVLRFGEVDEYGRPQARPCFTGIAARSFQYLTLVKFVPATLADEEPEWWENLPSNVAEFLKRAAFLRDCDRVDRLIAIEPANSEQWRTLLCNKHAVFQNKHILFHKLGGIAKPSLPAGLPRAFH